MNRINEFAEASSVHGIKYVLSKNRIKSTRIFWTIAIFFSACGLGYYVYSGYNKFMYDPEIVMKARERPALDFPAPAVTVCSNLFARDNKANLFHTIEHMHTNTLSLTNSNCSYLAANIHWCQPTFAEKLLPIFCPQKIYDNVNVLKLINQSAYNVGESFNGCNNIRCQSIMRVFTSYGICFMRNSVSFNSLFNSDVISDDFKCYLKFYEGKEDVSSWTPEKGYESPEEDYPMRATRNTIITFQPILKAHDKANICALKNFRIYFHKPNEILTPFHESTFLNFDEYVEFRIFPKSHRTDEALRRFHPDQRKCYFEGERQLRFFKTYTKAHCEWECRANATLKECKCVLFSMPRDKKTRICNITDLTCAHEVETVFCDCHQPCIDVSYSYKADKTNYDRTMYKNIKEGDVMSWFQVNMGAEVVEEIENFVSYKLQNFISDFGGLLGLFMGCSLLSIVEIFYYLFGGFFSLIFKRKPRQTTPIIQVQPNNTVELKSCSSQVSNNDILYAVNALNKTVHEIEMRFIKDSRDLRIRIENLEERNREQKDINLDKSIKVNKKYDIKKILQTIEIEDL